MSDAVASDLLNEISDRGWTLSHSPPPYSEELSLPALPRRPPVYSLLILDFKKHDRESLAGLHEIVASLRRKFVAPVFGRPGDAARESDSLALREALAAAGGELLPPSVDIGHRAREVLTIRPNLASDWIRWYRLHREIEHRAEDAVRALVNHATKPGSLELDVDRLLKGAGMSPRSARYWLAHALLPPPGAWARGSRLLQVLLALQRDPELDDHDAALATGYGSSEALSNAMFRYFAHGVPKGRRIFGLEPRFRAFDQRFVRLRS